MKVIGISGTDASGKDTVGQMLAERYSWLFLTVTDILREEAKKQNLPMERQSYRQISAEWRRDHGMAVLIDYTLQKFQSLKEKYQGLAVASLRHPAEADRIHELGGQVVWVDADPQVRYERVVARNRGTEDRVTLEEFMAEEQTQMNHSGDGATLNLSGVKEKADIFLENNGSDIEKFKDEAEKALTAILEQ